MISKSRAKKLFTAMHQRCDPQSKYYQGSSVCSTWNQFEPFYDWIVKHYVEGYDLDKDWKVLGNKTYSPDTCAFIPQNLNKLVVNCVRTGPLPLGVRKPYYTKEGIARYAAECRYNNKVYKCGVHATPELAHNAWLIAKADTIKEVATLYACDRSCNVDVLNSLLLIHGALIHAANMGATVDDVVGRAIQHVL